MSGKQVHVQVALTAETFREGEDVGLVITIESCSPKTEIVSWVAVQFQSFSQLDKTAQETCPLSLNEISPASPPRDPEIAERNSPILEQVKEHFRSTKQRSSKWKRGLVLQPEPSIAFIAKNIVIEPRTVRRWIYGFSLPTQDPVPPTYKGVHVRIVHNIALAIKMYKAPAPQSLLVPVSIASSLPFVSFPLSSHWFRQNVVELSSLSQIQSPVQVLARLLRSPQPTDGSSLYQSDISVEGNKSEGSRIEEDDFDDEDDVDDEDDKDEDDESAEEDMASMRLRSFGAPKMTHFQINCDDQSKAPLLRLSTITTNIEPGQTLSGLVYFFSSSVKSCHQITLSIVAIEELKTSSAKVPAVVSRKTYAQQELSTLDLVSVNWSLWIPPTTPVAFETTHMRVTVCLRLEVFLSKAQNSTVCAMLDHLEPVSSSGMFGKLMGGPKDNRALNDHTIEEVTGVAKEIIDESRFLLSKQPVVPIDILSWEFPLKLSHPASSF